MVNLIWFLISFFFLQESVIIYPLEEGEGVGGGGEKGLGVIWLLQEKNLPAFP